MITVKWIDFHFSSVMCKLCSLLPTFFLWPENHKVVQKVGCWRRSFHWQKWGKWNSGALRAYSVACLQFGTHVYSTGTTFIIALTTQQRKHRKKSELRKRTYLIYLFSNRLSRVRPDGWDSAIYRWCREFYQRNFAAARTILLAVRRLYYLYLVWILR